MWDAGSPWSAIFLKAAEDDETCWDDNILHPAITPDQEGQVCGVRSRREERSWALHPQRSQRARATEREERTKKLATQSIKTVCSCASVGISVVGHVASFHWEAHVRRAEFTKAPCVSQTSTRRGSVHRLDKIKKRKELALRKRLFLKANV